MSLALLVSRVDSASVNIGAHVRKLRDWDAMPSLSGPQLARFGDLLLVEIDGEHLHADDLDAKLADLGHRVDAIVVLSRHRAASGSPSLTVHPIGNYRAADFGGRPGHLVPAMPAFMGRCLRSLAKRAPKSHAVTFEATHHGPALSVPACFVEIGSKEEHWEDGTLGRIVAEAVLEAAEGPLLVEPGAPNLVVIGGSHYAPKALDLVRKKRANVGHIVPSYQLEGGVAAEGILSAIAGTPECAGYVLDDRGLATDKLAEALTPFTGLELGRWLPEEMEDRPTIFDGGAKRS